MKLTVKQVTHRYKNFLALKNINFEFKPGIYGLLGPNRAGKSTFMRILVDVLAPTSGMINYEGRNISILKSQYRDILGYLLQDFNGYPHFTAYQ